MLQGRIRRALLAGALAVVAGLAFGLAAPQSADAQTSSSGWQQVATGAFHTCALSTTSTISCWGSNGYGQTTVPAGTYRQVAAGIFHTCAVSTAGAISCWGSNSYGQTTVPAGTYRQVTAGGFHTCAVSTAGARSCWGSARHYGLGGFHTCRVSSGTVSCSGSNVYGQTNAPTTGTYRQVSVGRFHSCAVSTTGTITCWGSNTYGQTNAPAPPAAPPPPRPAIGGRHADGYFPLSFGDATLGQLNASGAALTVELAPANSVTGPAGRGAFAFQPGAAGGGPAAAGLGLAALAALRDEVGGPGDYDGAAHGGLAIPDLPVYVRYAASASSSLRAAVLKVTLAPASGAAQTATRTISIAPPAAPVAAVAGVLRGDADQAVDLAQRAELAISLSLGTALPGNQAALTKTCLSALGAAPTAACPAEVALGPGSQLVISGPATFEGTNGAKILQGGLKLRCTSLDGRADCLLLRDHGTDASAPSIRVNDDATRDIAIDALLVAPSGTAFYAQLMNADGARPLYNDATGSYYQLASKYAGRQAIPVNCTLTSETESIIEGATAGPGETQVIEQVRTKQCTTASGDTRTFTDRTRHATTVSNS